MHPGKIAKVTQGLVHVRCIVFFIPEVRFDCVFKVKVNIHYLSEHVMLNRRPHRLFPSGEMEVK